MYVGLAIPIGKVVAKEITRALTAMIVNTGYSITEVIAKRLNLD